MFTIYNTAHTRRAVFVYAQSHNAQLRGEQRYRLNLKYCAINTKFEVEAKCRAL